MRARQANLDLGSLKDVMTTLKLAGDVIGGARKELFEILNVEKHEKTESFDELPELVVRELTGNEIGQLQLAAEEDLELENDVGAEMLPDDGKEGL